MKILLVTQDFPPTEGGIARGYADLARGFPPGSFVVSTTRPEGPAGGPPPHVPVRYEPFPFARAHRLQSLWRWRRDLATMVREEKPDLIVCGNIRPLGPLCASLAKRTGIPYYVIVHGNDLFAARRRWSGLRSGTWSRVFGGAARWIANSDAVRRIGIADLALPEATSAVVLPEVDTTVFRPPAPGEKDAIRKRLGIGAEERVVIFVGRLVVRKGLDRLMEALGGGEHAGTPAGTPWRLLVAGFGDPAPYEALAARLGVRERVIFRAAVSEAELTEFLRAADVAAMPSRTIPEKGDIEGFGIVFLEAAAAGLPVVAGRSGGVAEAVEDGVTGLLVDGNDAAAIRAALDRLLTDGELRVTMGRAARTRVEERFRAGSRAAAFRKIVEEDLGGRR